MTTSENAARARETAQQWWNAWRTADLGRIAGLLADDCIVWRNYEQVEHRKTDYISMLERNHKAVRDLRIGELRQLAHADGFVEQATLEGEAAEGALAAPFCRVVALKDRKISRIDEYFDSTILAAALR